MTNSKLAKRLYTFILGIIYEENIMEEKEVDEALDELSINPMFHNKVTLEEIEEIRKKIKASISIKLDLGSCIEEKKHEKWFANRKANLDMRYWQRYRRYLQKKGFTPNVINSMDIVLDRITDLLGDPTREIKYQRKGLVIGDVQSGKTANYTGLMCKAADSGYRVVVLLAGTLDKLRKQTQSRIDDGFIGWDSAYLIKSIQRPIGVGQFDSDLYPVVLTSTESDFNLKVAQNSNLKLNSLQAPILFVVKKNAKILEHLDKWLELSKGNKEFLEQPLLLIDDEADNASVNTKKPEEDPTAINRQIRNILSKFSKSSYVGFTATPYANIFINPNIDDEEMTKDDLFPKDYIYSLDAPSDYIGARDIFGVDGKYCNMLEKILDGEEYYPMLHKNGDIFTSISPSLKEAIISFLIVNTIRDLRGDVNTHRSMLINISRFTNVQNQIYELVSNCLKEIQNSVRINSKLSPNEALDDEHIMDIYRVFELKYSQKGYSWDEIQNGLLRSIEPIIVAVINQKNNNELNYDEYKKDGLRVIAIGGLSLSRGLTLEGLVISYLYRNTKVYDTLMQMGRWFGYRSGYADLCKIWLSIDSIEWYQYISDATDELRSEIKRMENQSLTPLEFGLRVRNDSDTLIVTAYNKMRTATTFTKNIILSGEIIETPNIFNNPQINQSNLNNVKMFASKLENNGYKIEGNEGTNARGFKNVEKKYVEELLSSLQIPIVNYKFNVPGIIDFIDSNINDCLDYWDVCFVNGSSSEYSPSNSIKINLISRSFALSPEYADKIIKISGQRNRLGSPKDAIYGLSQKEKEDIEKKCQENITDKETDHSIGQKAYFQYAKRRPLLSIYLIDLNCEDLDKNKNLQNKEIKKAFNGEPLVGFGIGIPIIDGQQTLYAKYKINLVEQEHLNRELSILENEE